ARLRGGEPAAGAALRSDPVQGALRRLRRAPRPALPPRARPPLHPVKGAPPPLRPRSRCARRLGRPLRREHPRGRGRRRPRAGHRGSALIKTTDLRKHYGEGAARRAALDGVDLSVETGELVTILGPSGSGKSTLLAILGGLDLDYEGQVSLFGQDPKALSDK